MAKSTCNDCGKAFDGEDAKAAAKHAADAHPGMGRYRWRTSAGVNFLSCPDCDHVVEEGGPKHLSSTGRQASGSPSDDPKDFFDLHLQSHRSEA